MAAASTCRHGVMTGDAVEGEVCQECLLTHEDCLDGPEGCKGAVEYRESLTGTGTAIKRCDEHWSKRLDLEQELRERYPVHPPSDFDPSYAGESWDEDY